ncbi:MAG: thiamine-phosphate pyrophosphorylase [Caulobacteraceae bacterium]|nr:thiamine-phosphate pyrophosphorylase [Caulobacteraceae bacterium]
MSAPPCRLYLITPPVLGDPRAFATALAAALDGGDVGAVQLRLKDLPEEAITAAVRALLPVTTKRDVALILNDRPDLAARLGCDGVHIGQSDGPYDAARRAVGPGRVVGVTCHDSRDLAMEAAEAGADYVAFGAFFPTTTKATVHRPDLELLEIWQESMLTPCVAIGGITVENCGPLVTAGADFLAVSAGVWTYPQGPAAAVAAFNGAIAEALRLRPQT